MIDKWQRTEKTQMELMSRSPNNEEENPHGIHGFNKREREGVQSLLEELPYWCLDCERGRKEIGFSLYPSLPLKL